jgi:hypothetical protein
MSRSTYLGFALALAACGGAADGVGGRPGDMGQVEATPECGALSQACIGQGLDAPIARGSTVDLAVAYKVAGSSGPPTILASANEAVIQPTGATQLKAVGDGMTAILFVGLADEVIDLVHVWVQTPSELRILRYDDAGDLLGRVQPSSQLLVGDEILVALEPFANGQPLLGNFDLTFGTTNASAVQIVPDPVGGWYRVVARAPGRGRIDFAALGITAAWDVEVLP